jgi:hypothetical protein
LQRRFSGGLDHDLEAMIAKIAESERQQTPIGI